MHENKITDRVRDHFVRYARFHTTSNITNHTIPTTKGQKLLADAIVLELSNISGEIVKTPHGSILFRVPSNIKKKKILPIALFAHLDTSPDCSGYNVQPQVWSSYDGKVIRLKNNVILDPDVQPLLKEHIGDTIITADGTTLLGADDKAGVAEIMTFLQYLQENPMLEHGEIEVVFNFDEEIGRGIQSIPLSLMHAQCGITVDGYGEGLIETECFNAFFVTVFFKGVAVHPGTAKNRMVNAISMASAFLDQLPQKESPEATEGRDGFYCSTHIQGGMETAQLHMLVRDYDIDIVHRRIAVLKEIAKAVAAVYAPGTVRVRSKKQYLNMRKTIENHPSLLPTLLVAVQKAGMQAHVRSIRGGTDGALLAELGIPAVNLFTGGVDFHGPSEWLAVSSMVKAVQTLVHFVSLWTKI